MSVKGTAQDRWKRKEWYTIQSTKLFNEVPIGEVLASDPEQLMHRRMEATVHDLMGDVRKQHMKFVFEVERVVHKTAQTRMNRFELVRTYIRSLVRRRTNKVEGPVKVVTKDEQKLRIKPLIITFQKCKTAQKKTIRLAVMTMITALAKERTFDEFILDVVSDKIPKIIKDEVKKVYPIKNVEIRRIDIIRVEEKKKKRHEAKKLKELPDVLIDTEASPKRSKKEIKNLEEPKESTPEMAV